MPITIHRARRGAGALAALAAACAARVALGQLPPTPVLTCGVSSTDLSRVAPGTVLQPGVSYCCGGGGGCVVNFTIWGGGGAGPGWTTAFPAPQPPIVAGGAGAGFNVSVPLRDVSDIFTLNRCSFFTASPGGGGSVLATSNSDAGGSGGGASALLCGDAVNLRPLAVAGGGGGAGASLENVVGSISNGGDAARMPGEVAMPGYNGACLVPSPEYDGGGGGGAGSGSPGGGGSSDISRNVTPPCAIPLLVTVFTGCSSGTTGTAGSPAAGGAGLSLFPGAGGAGGGPVGTCESVLPCPVYPGGASPGYGAVGGDALSCGSGGGGGGGGYYGGGGGGGSAFYFLVAPALNSGAAGGGGGGSSFVNSALGVQAYGPLFPLPYAAGSGGVMSVPGANGTAGVIIYLGGTFASPTASPSSAASPSVSPSSAASPSVFPSPAASVSRSTSASPASSRSTSVSPSVSAGLSLTPTSSVSPSFSVSPSVSASAEPVDPAAASASASRSSLVLGLGIGGALLVLAIVAAVLWFWCGYRPSFFRGKKMEPASAARLATLGAGASTPKPMVEDWSKSDRNLLGAAAADSGTPSSRVAYNPVHGRATPGTPGGQLAADGDVRATI